MQRPIEKFGWKLEDLPRHPQRFIKIELLNVKNIIDFRENEISIIAGHLSFEKLQAIYETAKQIREENYDK